MAKMAIFGQNSENGKIRDLQKIKKQRKWSKVGFRLKCKKSY